MRTEKVVFLICIFCATAAVSAISSIPRQQTWVTNGRVNAIAVAGGKVYLGGSFTTVGPLAKPDSIVRNHLVCFDTATGAATAWNPNVNGGVNVISVIGSKVYIGGLFDTVGGQRRKNIACLDTGTGQPSGWDPNSKSSLNTLFVDGAKVYVGTNYDGLGCDSIGGKKRRYAACVDTGTGLANNWNPGPYSFVYALIASGDNVYVGGAFTGIAVTSMHYLSCIDSGTSQAKASFYPGPDGPVYALLLKDTNLYVGGDFWSSMGGQTRNCIACISSVTGLATPWNPNANRYTVRVLAINGANVFAGGGFRTIGGQTRNYIASLDTETGLATNWDPNANNTVYAIAVNGTNVYIGGTFTTIGGAARPYFAEFGEDPATVVNTPREISSKSFSLSVCNFSGNRGTVRYSLPYNAQVSIRIYDMKGKLLASEANQAKASGNHTVRLSSDRLGSGLYLLRFNAGAFEKTQSITIMR
jgi:trimeric autotransporter adhesin